MNVYSTVNDRTRVRTHPLLQEEQEAAKEREAERLKLDEGVGAVSCAHKRCDLYGNVSLMRMIVQDELRLLNLSI